MGNYRPQLRRPKPKLLQLIARRSMMRTPEHLQKAQEAGAGQRLKRQALCTRSRSESVPEVFQPSHIILSFQLTEHLSMPSTAHGTAPRP